MHVIMSHDDRKKETSCARTLHLKFLSNILIKVGALCGALKWYSIYYNLWK